jgi:hypothetical protein
VTRSAHDPFAPSQIPGPIHPGRIIEIPTVEIVSDPYDGDDPEIAAALAALDEALRR